MINKLGLKREWNAIQYDNQEKKCLSNNPPKIYVSVTWRDDKLLVNNGFYNGKLVSSISLTCASQFVTYVLLERVASLDILELKVFCLFHEYYLFRSRQSMMHLQ